MAAPKKALTHPEKEFCRLQVELGFTPVEAARKALGLRCEPGTSEVQKVKDLLRMPRIKAEMARLEVKVDREIEASQLVATTPIESIDNLKKFAYIRLAELRDNQDLNSNVRFAAVQALEKLHDPSTDINLVLRWVDVLWRYVWGHCPSCHTTFPLSRIKNIKIEEYRDAMGDSFQAPNDPVVLDTRLTLLKLAEPRKTPHPGQIKALAAPERHIVGQAAARAGKCVGFDEEILLADGQIVPAKDLLDQSFQILAYNEKTHSQVPASGWATLNGTVPVYKITTTSGRSITRSFNHPLLKCNLSKLRKNRRKVLDSLAWEECSKLKVGDNLLTPKHHVLKHLTGTYDENKLKLLGYLLGDGGTTHGISFTQEKNAQLEEFTNIIQGLGCTLTPAKSNPYTYNVVGVYTTRHSNKHHKNHVINLAEEWGLRKKKAINKEIPAFVFQLSLNEIALVLNRLFACDGYAYLKKSKGRSDRPVVGITLGSEKLINQIDWLMLRFGIRGRLRKRDVKLKEKTFQAWEWYCTDIPQFVSQIGIFGKEQQLEKCLKAYTRQDYYWAEDAAPEGYYIDTIKSVEYLGEQPTINISVAEHHTFVTKFVEHNSFLISMFALMGILLPGVEIWLIARIYEDAGQEADYLKGFLKSLFHPYDDKYFKIREDKMNGELVITTKWNSILKIRSAKSKGSLTARELELALVAEPGWLDESVYEEIRARMSSRLGRIIALGTPKGATGFLSRLVRSTGRDPVTRRIIRRKPEDRLIENGCPWGQSMLIYNLKPTDNPEYVQSELEAARMELTDAEYASEFEGKVVSAEGAKYPYVDPGHLRYLPRQQFKNSKFILGIDQGPKNFGACLVAWDTNLVVPCYEFFDSSEKTMKANLLFLLKRVPNWITTLGGDPQNWVLTVTDQQPTIRGTLMEMAQEGSPWRTEIEERYQNNRRLGDNWRRECQEYVNELARTGKLAFHQSEIVSNYSEYESPGSSLLHDQILQVIDKPEVNTKESGGEALDKGWVVNDWRGDHVLDAWLFAMWAIVSGQVPEIPLEDKPFEHDPLEEQKNAHKFLIAEKELKELGISKTSDEVFESIFGRKRTRPTFGRPGYYSNES